MKETVQSKYGAATQIIVLEYDEFIKKLRVTKRYEIPPSEFTFDNAVNKIIELNEIWDPSFIYMDAGSGEYQIEVLRKYGEKNPQSGLTRKIKRIQFAEMLNIIDPVTGEKDRKQAKDFMINQTALLLEREQLSMSAFDEEMITQMTNYRVVGKTSSGRNKYSDEDHIIDALMLSILAFVLEKPELVRTIFLQEFSQRVRFSNKSTSSEVRDKIFNTNKHEDIDFDPGDNPNWTMKKITSPLKKKNVGMSFSRGSIGGSSSYRRSTF